MKAARQPAPPQDPRPEREAARAADREDGVRGELGEPDLGAGPPAHPPAEHRAEDQHVGRAGPELQDAGQHQPARLGAREPVPQRAQARDQHDEATTTSTMRAHHEQRAPQPRRRELVGQRLGLHRDRVEVLDGEARPLRAHAQEV